MLHFPSSINSFSSVFKNLYFSLKNIMGAENMMNTFTKSFFTIHVHVCAYVLLYIPTGDACILSVDLSVKQSGNKILYNEPYFRIHSFCPWRFSEPVVDQPLNNLVWSPKVPCLGRRLDSGGPLQLELCSDCVWRNCLNHQQLKWITNVHEQIGRLLNKNILLSDRTRKIVLVKIHTFSFLFAAWTMQSV